jgi:hypothetical protein
VQDNDLPTMLARAQVGRTYPQGDSHPGLRLHELVDLVLGTPPRYFGRIERIGGGAAAAAALSAFTASFADTRRFEQPCTHGQVLFQTLGVAF